MAYRRAIELDPNEPQTRIFYSHFLGMMRRIPESDREMARAVDIDPFNPFTQLLHGAQLSLTNRMDEAMERLSTVPPNPLRSHVLAWLNLSLGHLDVGLSFYREYFALLGDEEMADALQSDGVEPTAAMIRGAELLEARAAHGFVKPNNIVYLFTYGGDVDRAMDWAERAVEMRDHEVAYWGGVSHVVGPLRAHPRFRTLLEGLGLPSTNETSD